MMGSVPAAASPGQAERTVARFRSVRFASACLAVRFNRKTRTPAVPAPRRSTEHRRRDITPPSSNGHSRVDDYEDPPVLPNGHRPWHIATGYDTRLFAVCGEYVCTTGYVTRVWNLRTGESLGTLSLGDNIKVTSIVFKPAIDVADEGKRLWLGTNIGEIHELDIPSQSIVFTKPNAHPRREIIKMYRHASEIWSLDDDGKLHVWPPGPNGIPSLEETPNAFRVPKGHSFSVQCGNQLWVATGKDVRVFQPSAATETAFQLLQRPLSQPNAGDVTSGATITSKPDLIYFGHADGKVSIYNKRDYTCQGVINVSVYKISAMAGVGDDLWAGYNTGMAYVYDISNTPWRVKKDWKAHDNPYLEAGSSAGHLLGTDNMIRIWDGMLREDWLDAQMQEHDDEFCDFQEVTAAVLTWNAGASKPTSLRNDERDNNFFRDYMSSHNPPDIWVFGFQELVDLEDKKVTAKFFKSKKKDPTEQEHMSHQYRAWRDHLTRCLEDYMPANQPYTLLHTASMVGLFSCVYVKSAIRSRIKHIHTAEVKRGMGGLHGNKGALILRLALDDTSLCLINCHLAAGQSQTIARNNDVAAILEAECLPPLGPPLGSLPDSSLFVSGGDGSMILDHEICILNGDLNYRIDAMSRDTVVKAVLQRNLAKLLERDQLLLSRKKNPGFRLRAFSELPISFAPTYKYDVGTDEYDSSEKKRSPAWCDRIMCRGVGRVKGEEYRRWEVRVSDHRPVSCRFRCRVKRIDSSKKMRVRDRLEGEFERFRDRVAGEVK
ncbi:hypothetical protein H2203_002131 [Taxawa tesnikishii (nom. ined.)]|nr:hypothetical protein H2203_002131 [Dothideales sp. JES 119]